MSLARGRPKAISDEKILATARDVFLERGIRATTSDVAARAGISEGTIFHRFKSKDALFRAAMRFDPDSSLASVLGIIPDPGTPDLRAVLVKLGHDLLDLGRRFLPMLLMSWSNPTGEFALEKMGERKMRFDVPTRALARFFEAEMNAGRLEPRDPDILARAFMGTLRDYCMQELLQSEWSPTQPPGIFVERLVDIVARTPQSQSQSQSQSHSTRSAAPSQPRPKRAAKVATRR